MWEWIVRGGRLDRGSVSNGEHDRDGGGGDRGRKRARIVVNKQPDFEVKIGDEGRKKSWNGQHSNGWRSTDARLLWKRGSRPCGHKEERTAECMEGEEKREKEKERGEGEKESLSILVDPVDGGQVRKSVVEI